MNNKYNKELTLANIEGNLSIPLDEFHRLNGNLEWKCILEGYEAEVRTFLSFTALNTQLTFKLSDNSSKLSCFFRYNIMLAKDHIRDMGNPSMSR